MNTYCPYLWQHLYVSVSGFTRPCCVATGPVNRQLDKTNDTAYNSIRLQMLNGEKPMGCKQACYNVEDRGGKSKRQGLIERGHFTYDEAVNVTNDDGSIEPTVYDLDLRLGNTCDLACIMCGTVNSSKWVELLKDLPATRSNHAMMTSPDGMTNKWWEDEEFWDKIKPILHLASRIKFGGGEPLLLKKHKWVLEYLAEHNPNCDIKYVTNGNNITQEYIDLWKTMPRPIRFTVSVDAVGQRLEYQRWPIKWDTLLENIKKLKQLPIKPIITFNYTLSLFNVLYLNGDLEYFYKHQDELGLKYIDVGPVNNVPHLAPGLLPAYIKNQLYFIREPEQIKAYLNASKYDKELTNRFLEYTKELDDARGTNFSRTFPMLSDMLRNS